MSIYIAHHRKNNASNALDVSSTVQRGTSSMYDKNSQFACHASCFGTSSTSLVQRQRRCDGGTYRAETVEQREDGGWRNEDLSFSNLSDRCTQLRQIIRCLAMQALVHRDPKLVCDSICHIEPM